MMISSANNKALFVLASSFLLLSLSLFNETLPWINLLAATAFVMRLALFMAWQKHLPSLRTLNLLAVLCAVVLAYFAWQLDLLKTMLNLLVMACALKLMLLRTQKDYLQLILCQFFLIACGFIFYQGLGSSLFYALMSFVTLMSLGLYFSPSIALTQQLNALALQLAQASPIALLLFLVMPQLPPLWQMPTSTSSQTGLSDSIKPGDIASLSQSADLAFRASFDSELPAPQMRYWRALVMEDFDGSKWQLHPRRKQAEQQLIRKNQPLKLQPQGQRWTYQIIAETASERWLFALDLAQISSEQDLWRNQTFALMSQKPLMSQLQYQVHSYPQTPLVSDYPQLDKNLNLQLPENGNPQTRQWVAKLKQQFPKPQGFIQALQSFFQQQNFVYTLTPPTMPTDPVDRFLFDHQAGFCAHYASAFAYALRLGGIPARVVAGYQGGEATATNVLSVYQYDAHAWVEAWLPLHSSATSQHAWTRLDPTAWVAPERIQYGLQAAMAEQQSFLSQAPFALVKFKDSALFNQLRLALANLDYQWSRWVLGFNHNQQQDLLKTLLGQLNQRNLLILGLAIAVVIAALLALYFLPKRQHPPLPRWKKRYQLSLRLLEKQQIYRQPWHGVQTFAQQVNRQLGKRGEAFYQLSQAYQALAYGSLSAPQSKQQQALIEKQYKQFKQTLQKHKHDSKDLFGEAKQADRQ